MSTIGSGSRWLLKTVSSHQRLMTTTAAVRCVLLEKLYYLPESPPVSALVPLKTAGAPIHEYDMMPK